MFRSLAESSNPHDAMTENKGVPAVVGLNTPSLTTALLLISPRLRAGRHHRPTETCRRRSPVPIPVQSGVIAWQRALPSSILFRTRVGVLDRRARDPYALWDVYAGRSAGKLHPFVQVSNLTATSYQEIQRCPVAP
jgi:hypothetical protein